MGCEGRESTVEKPLWLWLGASHSGRIQEYPRVILGIVDCTVDVLMARALGCVVRLLLRDLAKLLVDLESKWRHLPAHLQKWRVKMMSAKSDPISLYTYIWHTLSHNWDQLSWLAESIWNKVGWKHSFCCVKCPRSIKTPLCIVMKNTWQMDAMGNLKSHQKKFS